MFVPVSEGPSTKRRGSSMNIHRERSFIATIVCALLVLFLGSAWGEGPPRHVEVPPGDLASAVQALAKQTGTEIIFQSDQLAGMRTRGVTGTLTVREAALRLLEGTPLTVIEDSSGA